MKVKELPLDRIIVKKNIRLEADDELGGLMDSIERHELLQPIVVFPRGDKYELVCGHRRLAAFKLRNESTIAARILEECVESDLPLIKLQENLQRKQLTMEEIVAAADEMRRQRPELTDHGVEKLIGKNPGYLSNCRSTLRALTFLQAQGISKEQAEALSGEEIREMRAKIIAGEDGKGKRTKTFHRGERVPKKGFRFYSTTGPAIMVICSSKKIKHRIWMQLSRLQKEIA